MYDSFHHKLMTLYPSILFLFQSIFLECYFDAYVVYWILDTGKWVLFHCALLSKSTLYFSFCCMLSSPSLYVAYSIICSCMTLGVVQTPLGMSFSRYMYCHVSYTVCTGRTKMFPLEGMRHNSPTRRHDLSMKKGIQSIKRLQSKHRTPWNKLNLGRNI